MDSPLVSIIIPTFNRADIISDTLESIVLQSYLNWECILIDDGSTDETISVINEYASNDRRFSVLKRPPEKKKGANACRNYGLSIANGAYIIFFDSDDIMGTTCLEERLNYFAIHNDKDFLVFSMGVFVEKTQLQIYPSRKFINLNLKETIEEFVLSDKIPWQVSRPIYKSKFIKGRIKFNEEMQNLQDDEFQIRLLGLLKPSYLSIDITDSYYRFDEISLNKYYNFKGKQDLVDCLYLFYCTVFRFLDQKQKQDHKKKLMLRFFNSLRNFVMPNIKTKNISLTIKLFRKELGLSYFEVIPFYLIVWLNKLYYNKKGHYYLSSKLKTFLN